MPLPSLYISRDGVRAWSVTRAAGYGAALGALAGLFKTLGPLRAAVGMSTSVADSLTASLPEIAAAAIAFALLCAAASALRNFIARRLIWPEIP